ncbi:MULTISPECIES: hypothetical protein [Paenibacillus]|uniref:hypothetical protein n=1 Tax=Paenibacillus TaxID=44249 RepID=UPI0006D13707|nr:MULTISPECIES: hypothetical protein [Paenibacillus]
MYHTIQLLMWLALFGAILIGFIVVLLQLLANDSTEYDMEFLWNHRYTLEDLHLNQDGNKNE